MADRWQTDGSQIDSEKEDCKAGRAVTHEREKCVWSKPGNRCVKRLLNKKVNIMVLISKLQELQKTQLIRQKMFLSIVTGVLLGPEMSFSCLLSSDSLSGVMVHAAKLTFRRLVLQFLFSVTAADAPQSFQNVRLVSC